MRWSDLTFQGYRDGRDWTQAESMIHSANLALHQGGYRSPQPEGRLTACLQPSSKCLELGYVFTIDHKPRSLGYTTMASKDYCRAPDDWVCPYKTPSKTPALGPQHTKYVDKGKAPMAVQTDKAARIRDWFARNLLDIHSHAAQVTLGLDEPTTEQELRELGEELVRRYIQQMPQRG